MLSEQVIPEEFRNLADAVLHPQQQPRAREAGRWLDEVPGVVAVAQGEDQGAPTVDVWVASREGGQALPRRLHGVAVRVVDAGGPIRALDDDSD